MDPKRRDFLFRASALTSAGLVRSLAPAGLAALGRYQLPGVIAVETLFDWSFRVVQQTQRLREAVRGRFPDKAPETGRA
jgi:hypothetical protein